MKKTTSSLNPKAEVVKKPTPSKTSGLNPKATVTPSKGGKKS